MPLAIVGGSGSIYAEDAIEWPRGTVITGYVSDEELAALFEAARGVVFVSLAEGFGLPFVEAAAAGVHRFVLSDIEVFHWVAGDGAIYVDPMSESAIADALSDLIRVEEWPEAPVDVDRFVWEESVSAVVAAAHRVADE